MQFKTLFISISVGLLFTLVVIIISKLFFADNEIIAAMIGFCATIVAAIIAILPSLKPKEKHDEQNKKSKFLLYFEILTMIIVLFVITFLVFDKNPSDNNSSDSLQDSNVIIETNSTLPTNLETSTSPSNDEYTYSFLLNDNHVLHPDVRIFGTSREDLLQQLNTPRFNDYQIRELPDWITLYHEKTEYHFAFTNDKLVTITAICPCPLDLILVLASKEYGDYVNRGDGTFDFVYIDNSSNEWYRIDSLPYDGELCASQSYGIGIEQ